MTPNTKEDPFYVTPIDEDPFGKAPSSYGEVEELVKVGVALYKKFEELRGRLESLKEKVREEAEQLYASGHDLKTASEASGKVYLEGYDEDDGTIMVSFSKPKDVLKKSADIEAIREVLDPEYFEAIFKEETSYQLRPDARMAIEALPEGEAKDLLLESISVKKRKPSVYFQDFS